MSASGQKKTFAVHKRMSAKDLIAERTSRARPARLLSTSV